MTETLPKAGAGCPTWLAIRSVSHLRFLGRSRNVKIGQNCHGLSSCKRVEECDLPHLLLSAGNSRGAAGFADDRALLDRTRTTCPPSSSGQFSGKDSRVPPAPPVNREERLRGMSSTALLASLLIPALRRFRLRPGADVGVATSAACSVFKAAGKSRPSKSFLFLRMLSNLLLSRSALLRFMLASAKSTSRRMQMWSSRRRFLALSLYDKSNLSKKIQR
jgi:hypothetical protein